MDFRFDETEQKFRLEVEEFLKKELPPGWPKYKRNWPGGYGTIPEFENRDLFVESFRGRLADKGWLLMAWPKEYGGGGYSFVKQAIYYERQSYYFAPGVDTSILILGPLILRVGSEELKKEWIPKITKGNLRFWIGYSEPNAGSDLSSIRTAAVEDGDNFIINGQKIWISGAHISDYGWMAARTDPNSPPNKGITLFIVDSETEVVPKIRTGC